MPETETFQEPEHTVSDLLSVCTDRSRRYRTWKPDRRSVLMLRGDRIVESQIGHDQPAEQWRFADDQLERLDFATGWVDATGETDYLYDRLQMAAPVAESAVGGPAFRACYDAYEALYTEHVGKGQQFTDENGRWTIRLSPGYGSAPITFVENDTSPWDDTPTSWSYEFFEEDVVDADTKEPLSYGQTMRLAELLQTCKPVRSSKVLDILLG